MGSPFCSAPRRQVSIDTRFFTLAFIAGRKSSKAFLPAIFAWYIAVSALRVRVLLSSPSSGKNATPLRRDEEVVASIGTKARDRVHQLGTDLHGFAAGAHVAEDDRELSFIEARHEILAAQRAYDTLGSITRSSSSPARWAEAPLTRLKLSRSSSSMATVSELAGLADGELEPPAEGGIVVGKAGHGYRHGQIKSAFLPGLAQFEMADTRAVV